MMNTDGSRYEYICKPLGEKARMQGNEVLLFSLNEVSQSILEFKKTFDIKEDFIDYYVFHQAQKIILDGIANENDIDNDKVLVSYNRYGNTQSSSIH